MDYQKILVTGAAGFIGFYQVELLLQRGFHVVGLDSVNDYYDVALKEARLENLGIEPKGSGEKFTRQQSEKHTCFSFYRGQLENKAALFELFRKENFDAVIHLAAQPGVRYSIDHPQAYVNSNLVGFVNVLEACRHHNIKHLVYASSSSVYGESTQVPFKEEAQIDHPVSLYAATKKSNELMAHTYSHLYKLPCTGLRFFTVYGPWGRPDMAPMLFAKAAFNHQSIKVFNHGNMSRDFTYVTDIVSGVALTLEHPPGKGGDTPFYQIFNIGHGSPVSLMAFIDTLGKTIGRPIAKKMLPMQPGDVSQTWADTAKLQRLGYTSETSIETGILHFVKWYREFYNFR